MPEMKNGKKFTGAYGGKMEKAKITGGYKGGVNKAKIKSDVKAAGVTKKKPFDAKAAKAKVDALKKTMEAKKRAKYGGRFGEGNRP